MCARGVSCKLDIVYVITIKPFHWQARSHVHSEEDDFWVQCVDRKTGVLIIIVSKNYDISFYGKKHLIWSGRDSRVHSIAILP